jgi:hypothetical protein
MPMEEYKPGDRVMHTVFGLGTVVERVNADVIVVMYSQAVRKRLSVKHAPLSRPTREEEDSLAPGGKAYQEWLDKTFVLEGEEVRHYLGSHWSPFYDDVLTVVKRFPEILPKSLLQISFAEDRPPLRFLPPEWPRATYSCWPLRRYGITFVTTKEAEGERLLLVSFFPFDHEGIQQELVIEKVHVWKSGVEAQIECGLGGASITFFDSLFAENRGWYEAGKPCQFILSAFAYECRAVGDQVLQAFNPKLTREFKEQHPEIASEWPEGDTIPVHTKETAGLLPVSKWDRDDYWFRGPVKSIKEMEMLDQPAWRIRATVLRNLDDDREIDLDIIVTRKVWGAASPPQPGDDIEGTCWLQGYLWHPGIELLGR